MKKILLIGLTLVVAVGIAVPIALGATAPKATGNVNFAAGSLTGNVTFNAQATSTGAKGQLSMTNSMDYWMTGAVTCFKQIDANTAVFSGPVTAGTENYTTNHGPTPEIPAYFTAMVVDGSTSGAAADKIVVYVNDAPNGPDCNKDAGTYLADVSSGNLTVFQG